MTYRPSVRSWAVASVDKGYIYIPLNGWTFFDTPKEAAKHARLAGFEVDRDGTVWLDV